MEAPSLPRRAALNELKLVGRFVRSSDNELGIGKVVDTDDRTAIIEYFESISKRVREAVDLSSIKSVRLQVETRCYLWFEDEGMWQVGRVGYWDEQDNTYEVTLPGKRSGYVPETMIYVRCDKPVEDPTDTLILKGHETPFFHVRRAAFVHSLIEQRHAARGMDGLVSSNIDLYAHQAEVVRRVLEDPSQRYLLADEVGLGKTIEAGAILRQYLLDDERGKAVVLVPQFLLEQWQQELEQKFHAADFEERILLRAIEEVEEVSLDYWFGLLIIDEAHHVASGAYSQDPKLSRLYEHCRRLANRASRLLLLSATPVLNHEQDFLAMLHLLDPLTYKLDDLEAFRDRVRRRQDIGRVLLSFKEDAHPFVIRTSVKNLREAFPGDERLQGLLSELENLLQMQPADASERNAAIRSIRTHVSDTYRLHRRMLRNRRESVPLAVRMEAAKAALDLKEEYDLDERAAGIHELLDEWRVRAVGALSDAAGEPQGEALELVLRDIFLTLFRASGTWFGVFRKVIEVRLGRSVGSDLEAEFGPSAVKSLIETARFEGETEVLEAMLKILSKPAEDGDRVDLLQASIARLRNAGSKIVVFTSFSMSAQEITARLIRAFNSKAVTAHIRGMNGAEAEEAVERFRNDPACSVLVCDSSGEEGRNLQFADWLLHFDLPWSPNRLEQRIGRLDRIGRNRTVRSRVFLGPDSEDTLYEAWFRLLKEGFKIFENSIASLQFYVDGKLQELQRTLFLSGAAGLVKGIEQVKVEIEAELVKINEQNALDEIDALDKTVTRYFEELAGHDAQHERIKQATEGYAVDALRFGWTKDTKRPDVISYSYMKGRTLVSPGEVLNFFAHSLKQEGTYQRKTALQNPGINLYRTGQDFVDALAEYVRWDDRGQAFAMWRHEPTWDPSEGGEWRGFRFDYVVEARLDEAQAVLTEHGMEGGDVSALRRRADALFPPFVMTMFVDHLMREVTDPHLMKILSRPYSKHPNPGRDYNLDYKRAAVIDMIVGADLWASSCRAARERSESLLRESEQFREKCAARARSAGRQLGIRVEQLRMRLERAAEAGQGDNQTLAQDLEIEADLGRTMAAGISEPFVRLDSIGFMVVSGRVPPSMAAGGNH